MADELTLSEVQASIRLAWRSEATYTPPDIVIEEEVLPNLTWEDGQADYKSPAPQPNVNGAR